MSTYRTEEDIAFLWTDIETTGLDEKKDRILEIAWAITDAEFNVKFEPQSYVIGQDDWADFFSYWREDVSQTVKDMHAENGLFEELQGDSPSNLDRAYLELRHDLEALPQSTMVNLAGRSVHFDRGFLLNNDFDSLWDPNAVGGPLISHRIFDVRTIRTFFNLIGVTVPIKELKAKHRALSDVMGDIAYAKGAVELLRSAFPFPPMLVSEIEHTDPLYPL